MKIFEKKEEKMQRKKKHKKREHLMKFKFGLNVDHPFCRNIIKNKKIERKIM